MSRTIGISLAMLTLLSGTNRAAAQWVQINGPFGGSIICLAQSGTNLFAGGDGGVYISTNNGTKWNATGLVYDGVSALVASGSNLFASVLGGSLKGPYVVLASTDNGTSWTEASTGLPSNTGASSFAVSGTNIFAGTYRGVFLSTNNGTGWTAASAGLSDTSVQCLVLSPNGDLFAGTWSGVFRSTESGTSWTEANTGLTNNHISSLAVIPNGAGGINLFAGTYPDGVYLSTDNGANWTASNTGLPSFHVTCIAVSGNVLIAGTWGDGTYISTNNGRSWTAASTGLQPNAYVSSFVVSGTNLFAGTYGGFWRRSLSEMTTSVLVSVGEFPTRFTLEQNYPNPFNPTTNIRFRIAHQSHVSLKVFDLVGKEVSVLVNENKAGGVYDVRFDGRHLSSGVYYYRLQAGSYAETKHFILLK